MTAFVVTCSPSRSPSAAAATCAARCTPGAATIAARSSFRGIPVSSSVLRGSEWRGERFFRPSTTSPSSFSVVRMNISSNDFRTGTTIEMDGVPYRVLEFLHVKPGKGAAFVRTKLKNMRTGNNVDKTFKAGEMVASAQLEKVDMQHTYVDGADFVFMNMETFDEERMTAEILGDGIVKFLTIGQQVEVLKHNEDVIGVELPKTLTFQITDTEPGAKGNSASGNVLKPATIETGAQIMVPIFINIGDQVRINTEDGKYLGRSND